MAGSPVLILTEKKKKKTVHNLGPTFPTMQLSEITGGNTASSGATGGFYNTL